MIDTTIRFDGSLPAPAAPIRCDRRRHELPKNARLCTTRPRPEARPVWLAEPRLTVSEAAIRDYRRAWRRIKQG